MEDKKLDNKETPDGEVVELAKEALGQVSGGTDPFAGSPRVPEQPIDPELRDNG